MSTKTRKQPIEINITAQEIRNIVSSYDIDTVYNDDDRTYALKEALNALDVSDKIIYCLYLEFETKTSVAKILGISRISATRIIKGIEDNIRELVNSKNNLYNDMKDK